MKKRICVAAMIMVLLVIYVVRVVYVNENAYHVETERYAKGENCTYEDFTYRIVSCEVMDKSEIESKFNITYVEKMPVTVDYIVAELEVTYIGQLDEQMSLKGLFHFESNGWSNGCSRDLDYIVNAEDTVFKKGETKSIWKFGTLAKPQLTKREWKNRHSMKFDLYLANLPKEVIMECY